MKPQHHPRPKNPTTRRATVLLVEDHESIREILRDSIQSRMQLKVVDAGNLEQALAVAARHRPDMAIVDIGLPGANGIEVIRRLRREDPTIRVLVYSSVLNLQVARAIMQVGTQGFVNKSEPFSILRQAITAILAGKIWFSAEFNALLREALAYPGGEGHLANLTPREREVLLLVAQSHSSKEVAAKLAISNKTAENHRTNLMRKLGLHDTASLVRFTFRHGLLDPRLT